MNGTDVTVDALVGRWRRVDDGGSTTPYPQEIEFFPDRTYRATTEGTRRPVWDEAAFDVLPDGAVRIQTAHDRKVDYTARRSGDLLTLAAGDASVTYRRMPPGPSTNG
ncbi:hypothetical protein [Modestobacter excelsi]|uniref:hypothetical protein n=1 Tax=Modestobacter excelsi TaxID=2213161 RepID=UPI00110CBA73|nr:hypothetical protein [Modestobacter excelsi]